MVAVSFHPLGPVSLDMVGLQRQIEELSAKLENTQMRVVSEHHKIVQLEGHEHEGAACTSLKENWGCTLGGSRDKPNFSNGGQRVRNSCQYSNSGGT